MLRKYAKYFIIAILQLMGLVILTLLLTPLMLDHLGSIKHGHAFFNHFYWSFFIGHSMFYALLYFIWPHLINFLASRQPEQPEQKQLSKAMHARYYLIGAFLLIELFNLLR